MVNHKPALSAAFSLLTLLLVVSPGSVAAETSASIGMRKTTATIAQNIILITADGLRWQEVFRGLDSDMITTVNQVKNPEVLLSEFGADTAATRRAKLMPFLWDHVAKNGILYGNRDLGSRAHVSNNHWFSYPGYNEFLSGYTDDQRIKSNNKIPNPNATVFEWLEHTPGFEDKVAAFGAWDAFPYIFNTARCGFPVDDGDRPFRPSVGVTPGMEIINTIRTTTPRRWNGAHFDSLVFPMATEYIKAYHPRAIYIGLGETDEWGHEGNYEQYLTAAHRVDSWLRELYELTQSLPQYRDKTTFVFTCDHGRGDTPAGPKSWNSHGRSVPGSGEVWMAVWGPDTAPAGEVNTGEAVTAQIAATVAAALGYDYNSAQPKAASPLVGAVSGTQAPAP
jgi:hypothetical protein